MSGETCKCGHDKATHRDKCTAHVRSMDWCSCDGFTPVADKSAEPQWLDAPDGPGHWWRLFLGKVEMFTLSQKEALSCSSRKVAKWQRVQPHTPPSAPALPTSKQVTLTAKVTKSELAGYWNALLFGGLPDGQAQAIVGSTSQQQAIETCRSAWGIEPTVSDEGGDNE